MDIQRTNALIELVASERIEELVISEGTDILRIVRSVGAAGAAAPARPDVDAPPPARRSAPSPEDPGVDGGPTGKVDAAEASLSVPDQPVVAPMAGTFYRSSGRGAAPFVEVGTAVAAGTTLCVIEAMKIMNDVESDRDGQIVRVLCEDGEAVERGQTLFIIQ